MKIDIPDEAMEVARLLHEDGYRYCEAYPIEKWKKRGWSEDPGFFAMVDACLCLLRALGKYNGRKDPAKR